MLQHTMITRGQRLSRGLSGHPSFVGQNSVRPRRWTVLSTGRSNLIEYETITYKNIDSISSVDELTDEFLEPKPGRPTQAEDQSTKESFNWLKTWYPVTVVENLEVGKPNKVTLMGKDYVIWQDGSQRWRCVTDVCPHRMASLSEGLVVPETGNLMCSYHGWEFKGDGSLAALPQALSPDSLQTVCKSQRSCAQSYPLTISGGLVWMWPDDSPAAYVESAAVAPPLAPVLEGGEAVPEKGRWMEIDLPYSWDSFLENVLDPAHAAFSHHGVAGFDRAAFKPFDMVLKEDRGPGGFDYVIQPTSETTARSLVQFFPPCNVRLVPDESDPKQQGKRQFGLLFYCIPTRPGWSKLMGCSYILTPDGQPDKRLSIFTNALPVWLKHLLGFDFLHGDQLFLSTQTKYRAEIQDNWKQGYYMPTPADYAVIALRRWIDQYAGGAVPWPSHLQGHQAVIDNMTIPREVVLDRYESHVKHCVHCRTALENIKKAQMVAVAVAVVAAMKAVMAARVQDMVMLSGLLGTVPMTFLAVGAFLTWCGLKALEHRFYFVNHERKK